VKSSTAIDFSGITKMKKYIFVILLVLFAGVWFYTGDSEISPHDNSSATETISSLEAPTTNSISSTISVSSVAFVSQVPESSPVQNQPKPYDGWNSELPESYKNWKRSRGFFSDVDLQEYQGFKLDKLEELSNKGDLKAIEVLREIERSSGNRKRYKELTDLGVVYGSLNSLGSLSTEKKGNYMTSRKEEDALEMFAYMELQAKRGDLRMKHMMIPSDYKYFDFYPTQEQATYIDRRSNELMADFENRRKELGLPPFDNSPSESDKELYEVN
jgi:hypothetical protein